MAAAEKAAAEKAAAEKAEAEKRLATLKAAGIAAEAERALAFQKAYVERAAAAKAAAEKAAASIKKGVVVVRSLRVRADHTTESEMVDGLVNGEEITIMETWTDGKDTWGKLAPGQWAAMVYKGETYIKLAS
jgi:membrane protein involved in colicin uptake